MSSLSATVSGAPQVKQAVLRRSSGWTRSGSLSLSFSAAAGGRTGLPLPTSEEGGEGGG